MKGQNREQRQGSISTCDADVQFVDMVAAEAAEGRWDAGWLPRLLALARRGAKPPPLQHAVIDYIFDERFSWRNS